VAPFIKGRTGAVFLGAERRRSMHRIQILGPGCMRCKTLYENAETAARELGIECEIEKVSDIQQIVAFGVLATPGLVIDGVLKSSGRLLKPEEIKAYLV
jgi:small redox-active disulfide protein 2